MARNPAPCSLLTALLLLLISSHPAGAQTGPVEELVMLWQRGEKALEEGDTAAAGEFFRAALAIDRSQARSWNYLGGVYFSMGEYDAALLHFKQALLLNPRDARACNNIGTAYERLGSYLKAESFYLRAIEIDDRYPPPYRNLGVLYADRFRRPAEARRFWGEFLALVPEGPENEEIGRELERLDAAVGGNSPEDEARAPDH